MWMTLAMALVKSANTSIVMIMNMMLCFLLCLEGILAGISRAQY